MFENLDKLFLKKEPEKPRVTNEPKKIELKAQVGPQAEFLKCSADICFYGGGAGGGKTFALLLLPLIHLVKLVNFTCVIFRREIEQIKNGGGLWEESQKIYNLLSKEKFAPEQVESRLTWKFLNKNKIKFAGLKEEKSKYKYQGAQIPLILFDELTHFTKSQFFYLLSRNRAGGCEGINPYIRATCNPDCDSWVKDFIDWWIDEEGYIIPERCGVIRYFITDGDNLIWGDTKEEILLNHPESEPLSFTFIEASVYDNKILLDNDPSYLAKLKNLSHIDKMQLLYRNWKVRATKGTIFLAENFNYIDFEPLEGILTSVCRYWDRAGGKKPKKNVKSDYTSGTLIGKDRFGKTYILDQIRGKYKSKDLTALIQSTAKKDFDKYGYKYFVGLSQDPGSAGIHEIDALITALYGFSVKTYRETGDKITRANPFAIQFQNDNVFILKADWNKVYKEELEAFPEGAYDDQIDSSAMGFNALSEIVISNIKDFIEGEQIEDYSKRY